MAKRFRVFVLALLVLTPLMSWGETVMVTLKGSDRSILSAIEGGAMDVFYDQGHIVFNGVFYSGTGLYPTMEDFRTAREGGASLLMAIEVVSSRKSPKDPVLPVSLQYWLLRVADRKLLTQGKIDEAEIPKKESESWEEYVDRWGKEAALRAVKGFR